MDDKETKENSELLNDLPLEHNPTKDFLYFLWDLIKTGVIVFLIAFSIRHFLIQPFIVDGGSMLPTLIDDEYLLAEKLSYLMGNPKRGDIIIFKYPKNPTNSYIKRVIGLPGETVEIDDNQVLIRTHDNESGNILDETYLTAGIQTLSPDQKKITLTLDDGEYFVMGDNREHSSDSREWGVLPEENIIARAWLTIKPLDKFGIHQRLTFPEISFESLGQYAVIPTSSQ